VVLVLVVLVLSADGGADGGGASGGLLSRPKMAATWCAGYI
jgi:hypothetical protein